MQISKKLGAPHVVVDTNILIRAILKPSGSDGEIYNMFLKGEIILYYSDEQLNELNRVLRYPRIKKKYNLSDEVINSFISTIINYGKLIHPTEKIRLSRDPDDDELLAIAKSVSENYPIYIISGDKDLLVLQGKVEGVNIMTPQEFLKLKIVSKVV